jgi:chromosome partitioning protein
VLRVAVKRACALRITWYHGVQTKGYRCDMPVITVASGKGGVGKTLVSISLAAALSAEGVDVGLLDADPNRGAHRWATETYGHSSPLPAYAEADTERLADLVPKLADRHAVLIADTAGFGNRSTVICIGAADSVLVPASPGEGDIIEAQKMTAFVQSTAKAIRRRIEVSVIANRIRRGTTLSRHLLTQIDSLGLPRLKTTLSEAVAYGELGFAAALPAGQAAQEIAALLAELRALEWLPLSAHMPIYV